MLSDALYLALVVVVGVLMAVDVSMTPAESFHEQADRYARDAERAIPRVPHSTSALPGEPVAAGEAAAAYDSSPPSQHADVSSPTDIRQRTGVWSGAQHKGSHGALKNWPFRSRLVLLATI